MSKFTALTPSGRFPMALPDPNSDLTPGALASRPAMRWAGLSTAGWMIGAGWSALVALAWFVMGPLSLPVVLIFGLFLTLVLGSRTEQLQAPRSEPFLAVNRSESKENTNSLELQLRQAQKLEAVGRLAGGVAHDFNNLLTVIQGYGALLLELLRDQPQAAEMVGDIMKAGDKATALTRQLLFFSRKQVPVPRRCDINALVTNVEKMLGRLIGEDINLKVRLSPVMLPVKIDPGQFEQVLMNLVVNARDAMPTGGNLTIQTQMANAEAGYAVLSVADTGTGMDETVKAQLFEPFFTTKQPGKGTGLGLATVHGIVLHYGGYIQVHSSPGQGAEFRIFLPFTTEEAGTTEDVPTTPASNRSGTETILLVEDEKEVREMARLVLAGQGYQVIEARHGREALELCEQRQGNIDLVITDVVMPVMGGVELMENMSKRRPNIKILFMSGYNESAVVRHGLQEDMLACLHKPFTPDDLKEAVSELLESPVAC